MTKELNYTIIKKSGRTEWMPETTYREVLSRVYLEYLSAGSNWDRPNMLIVNGKVVVESGLADAAWAYGTFERGLRDETERKLSETFKPEWEAE